MEKSFIGPIKLFFISFNIFIFQPGRKKTENVQQNNMSNIYSNNIIMTARKRGEQDFTFKPADFLSFAKFRVQHHRNMFRNVAIFYFLFGFLILYLQNFLQYVNLGLNLRLLGLEGVEIRLKDNPILYHFDMQNFWFFCDRAKYNIGVEVNIKIKPPDPKGKTKTKNSTYVKMV